MKPILAAMTFGALLGCGGQVSLGDGGDSGSSGAEDTGADSPWATTPATSPKRTLDEFRGALVGVWEGRVTTDREGMDLPAVKVRLELKPDGLFVGTCLEPYVAIPRPTDECSAFFWIGDGPSPYRTFAIDRLTAGYEGMGVLDDRTHPEYPQHYLLHRVRLSADGQHLDFALLRLEDDDSPLHYWLTRVSR